MKTLFRSVLLGTAAPAYAAPPAAMTNAATSITTSSAVLNGAGTPRCSSSRDASP